MQTVSVDANSRLEGAGLALIASIAIGGCASDGCPLQAARLHRAADDADSASRRIVQSSDKDFSRSGVQTRGRSR